MLPGTHSLTLTWEGRSRATLLHLPPGTAPAAGWPAMMVLHGMGGSPAWTLQETGWDRFADSAGLAVVVPEGLPLDPARPASFWKNPPCWSDGGPRDAMRGVDDLGFLAALLDDLPARAPLDPQRVAVTGFSNGAAMAFRLAAEHAERLIALAPVAGYCRLTQPRPSRPVPTLYLAGTEDPYVPVAGGAVETLWGGGDVRPPLFDMLADWSRAQGGADRPTRLSQREGVSIENYEQPGGAFVVCLIEGLGHHWPGGRGQLSRRLFGPPSSRLDANRMIWDFCWPCPGRLPKV